MSFQDNLAAMPAIGHLSGLDVCNEAGETVHHIPAAPGKLGSLKLYHALAQQFGNRLNAEAAAQGLAWFAEHTADAAENPGKHPNVDLLVKVQTEGLDYELKPISA